MEVRLRLLGVLVQLSCQLRQAGNIWLQVGQLGPELHLHSSYMG